MRAKNGGVLVRPGQTEASVDMARIAGLYPAAVICEVMNEDGTMARLPQLEAFAAQHNLKMITVADLVRYRIRKEMLVRRVVETDLPTVYGRFPRDRLRKRDQRRRASRDGDGRREDRRSGSGPRPYGERHLRHVRLPDRRHRFQLHTALEKIAAAARGVVLYLRQREHSLDLVNQLRTYSVMQEKVCDKREASLETGYGVDRDYGVGAQILHDLGLRRILLLSNHPPKVAALEGFELSVVDHVPLGEPASLKDQQASGVDNTEQRT